MAKKRLSDEDVERRYYENVQKERTERMRRELEGSKKESIVSRIEKTPEAVLRRLTGGTKSFLKFLRRVVKWFFTWGLVILFIIFVAVVIVVLVRCWDSGTCTLLANRLGFAVGETPAARIAETGLFETLRLIWNPEELVKPGGPFSFEEEQVEVEQYGVSITGFKVDGFFELGEPINAIATVNIIAPELYDLVVDFSNACKMEDYNGRIKVTGPFTSEERIRVVSGNSEDFQIGCEFLDGIKDIENKVDDKVITFNPSYQMIQDITWLVGAKNIKAASDEKLGVTKATSKGPMDVSFSSLDSQPFYVNTPYRLHVGLDNNKATWKGRLEKINRVEIWLPENIRLMQEDQFCEFEPAGNAEGFNIYTVKNAELEIANVDCNSRDLLLRFGLAFDSCIDRFKDKLQYSCRFVFNSAEDVVSSYPFIAEISYTYVGEERTFVTLSKAI